MDVRLKSVPYFVISLLVAAMFVAMVYTLSYEARRRAQLESLQYGACLANNARFQALLDGTAKLRDAEYVNRTPGLAQVKEMRIEAYEHIIKEMSSIIRDCEKLYPGVRSANSFLEAR